jgi:hypothetical protein
MPGCGNLVAVVTPHADFPETNHAQYEQQFDSLFTFKVLLFFFEGMDISQDVTNVHDAPPKRILPQFIILLKSGLLLSYKGRSFSPYHSAIADCNLPVRGQMRTSLARIITREVARSFGLGEITAYPLAA